MDDFIVLKCECEGYDGCENFLKIEFNGEQFYVETENDDIFLEKENAKKLIAFLENTYEQRISV